MTAEPLGDDPIHRAAREALGYARLRPGQHEAIAALVDGRDCFAVLPGARVTHARWGDGVVQHGDLDEVTVAFDEVGYEVLALVVLRERSDVLRPGARASSGCDRTSDDPEVCRGGRGYAPLHRPSRRMSRTGRPMSRTTRERGASHDAHT